MSRSTELSDAVRINEPNLPQSAHELLLRVEGEYREMPGLNLTVSQAERLLGLDRSICAFVLNTLMERRVLKRTPDGKYLRAP